ncbi:MAG: SAM-dependent methyltransferase, partial [Verrucomicrobiota bacterium]
MQAEAGREGTQLDNAKRFPHDKRNQMANGNQALIDLIGREIRAQGPISFARFMELALYHPVHGYYASGRAKIGRRGDYFTNVSVGSIFGRLLAAQFAQIWQLLRRPDTFRIVEQGAHDGTLAADVLNALRDSNPDCFRALHYGIVEPFPVWRGRQQKKLNAFSGKVFWAAALTELKPIVGVFFANELFDALPVHLLSLVRGSWKELFVNVR